MQGPQTRASMLARLVEIRSDEVWMEFTHLYRPLIYRVARGKGLQHADAEDLTQDVLAIVRTKIGTFDVDQDGSFRGWLSRITRNLVVNHLTRSRGPVGSGDSDIQRMISQQPADDDETATLFQLEHRRARFRQTADRLKDQFTPSVWDAFWLTAVDQRSIESVAKELGKTPGAVRVARCRVLARLRKEAKSEDQ